MFDGAVLACGIHCLEHHEQRPAVIGVQQILGAREALDARLQQLFTEGFARFGWQFSNVLGKPSGIVLGEPNAFPGRNLQLVESLLREHHDRPLFSRSMRVGVRLR